MIFVEWDADKILVGNLGISRKEIIHARNKGNVCNRLSRTSNSKGLVDEDPLSRQPKYISKLKAISDKYEIKLLSDEKAKNNLIVLCPTLEGWILKVAEEVGIDISEYDLPNDADSLHKVINLKPKNFTKLMEDIKQESRMLKTLEGFIKS